MDAIRKFKEQQERKKQEEDEKKFKEKLSTLEHRAAQGDRKAKIDLKRFEKAKEDQSRAIDAHIQQRSQQTREQSRSKPAPGDPTRLNAKSATAKPRKVETDFEELIRLAKNNKNELRVEKPPPVVPKRPSRDQQIERKRPPDVREEPKEKPKTIDIPYNRDGSRQNGQPKKPQPSSLPSRSISTSQKQPQLKPNARPGPPQRAPEYSQSHRTKPPDNTRPILSRQPSVLPSYRPPNYGQQPRRPPPSNNPYLARYRDEDDEDDYEDEYECDGFVVDDEDDDARAELSRTLKSVFRYDKRRCDLREQELDREYRAIGRVSTFEDLEREERRASRLAAEEDSRAQREEDERRRLKKLRRG